MSQFLKVTIFLVFEVRQKHQAKTTAVYLPRYEGKKMASNKTC